MDRGEQDEDATVDVQSDTQRQDQERIHPRDNESGAGSKKITQRRLNWYGHVMRRDEEHIPSEENAENRFIGEKEDPKKDGKTHANET